VSPDKTKSYHSYLIRCWVILEGEAGPVAERFVVERVSDEPRRWGFNTLEDLIDFLRAELPNAAASGAPTEDTPD